MHLWSGGDKSSLYKGCAPLVLNWNQASGPQHLKVIEQLYITSGGKVTKMGRSDHPYP